MSFPSELAAYVGRVRDFERVDWLAYVVWIGMMTGLFATTLCFLVFGARHGAKFPPDAWMVPAGAAIFACAIAVDTIGHRTIYKSAIGDAEGLVHAITIFCGIGSCVLLCAAYSHRVLWIPAIVLTVLSVVYSLVDEVFHWRRYLREATDRVEMWSHVGILVGHATMMLGWWSWYFGGYAGVAETARALGGG